MLAAELCPSESTPAGGALAVEETAEEASTSGPENMNENEEMDGIDVEFNTDATVMEGGLAVRQNEVLKKPIIKEKYRPSNEDKIILRLHIILLLIETCLILHK